MFDIEVALQISNVIGRMIFDANLQIIEISCLCVSRGKILIKAVVDFGDDVIVVIFP